MGRTIKSKIKIKDIFFDEELYPRSSYDWRTAYDYAQSMRAGAVFPEIVLAKLNNKLYLVDGKHRIEAIKLLKGTDIPAVVNIGWDRKKIFKEAIVLNNSHGRILSPFEKRRIAVKLMEMNFSKGEVCKIIQVPEDKIENFIAKRMINSLTGEPVLSGEVEESARQFFKTIIKSGIKQIAGQTFSEGEVDELIETQKPITAQSQVNLLNQLLIILEKGLLDIDNKVVAKQVQRIKELLLNY